MDTRVLEYFVEIAKENNLSRAAENLYISQPALSQRLKKIESEIGTPLFHRKGNKVALTKAGIIFAKWCAICIICKKTRLPADRALQKI